ncbi:unnamed protein product [Schistosoma curassoni]|uniref:Uncharacterized protein n=1 Tax=Schistosoma curassoni TaxID=6186 RepID=A0A183KLE2_9TREM|nr:unnamed protein product [Schistosoma curassoni]
MFSSLYWSINSLRHLSRENVLSSRIRANNPLCRPLANVLNR